MTAKALLLAVLLPLLAAIAVGLPGVTGAGGASAQTPKRGGTVVFGPVGEPNCLNPVGGCGTTGPQYAWILEKVLPPAFTVAPDFTRKPALVSGVRVMSRAPFTLLFDIRREARWSDGVPVTAGDFQFTHQAILERLQQGDVSRGPHDLVRSVDRVRAKTFRVVFNRPVANGRDLFEFVLPRHALAGHDPGQIWQQDMNDPRTGRPIGSGPFLVADFERGASLTLVRNPRYWGPHTARLDRLVVRFCKSVCTAPPAEEVLDEMRAGAVDFSYVRDTSIVPELRRLRGTTVRLHRTNGAEQLTLQLGENGHPMLRSSKLVRQALAYGIDRAEIVRALWGALEPRYPPLHSLVHLNTERGYAANWDGYVYRPRRAQGLLERAGCRRGSDGIYVCGRERLSLRLFTTAGTGQRQRTVELVQRQLRRVGVEVVISHAPLSYLDTRDFDAFQFAWIETTGFGHQHIFGCGGFENYSGHCQRIVTADLNQADRILDPARRAAVLNRVDRQLAKDVPVIPLYQIPWVLAYKSSIRNVEASPDNLLGNAENWWLAE